MVGLSQLRGINSLEGVELASWGAGFPPRHLQYVGAQGTGNGAGRKAWWCLELFPSHFLALWYSDSILSKSTKLRWLLNYLLQLNPDLCQCCTKAMQL